MARSKKRMKPVEPKKEYFDDLPPKRQAELKVVDELMSSIEAKQPPPKSKKPIVQKPIKRHDEGYWQARQMLDKKMPKDSDSVNFED